MESDQETHDANPLAAPSRESLYKRQCRLRDEMLVLPVPPDTSMHPLAESCNEICRGMAMDPAPKHLEDIRKLLEQYRKKNLDGARLRIVDAMYVNYQSALIDPLNFREADEIGVGIDIEKRVEPLVHGIGAVHSLLMAEKLGHEEPRIRADLEEFYSERPLDVQAGLLIAYFREEKLKPFAMKYLTRWFGGCDLRADYIVLERYFDRAKACGGVAKYLSDNLPALGRWKASEARNISELSAETEAEESRRQSVQAARTAVGACSLCGKPLGRLQKLFGAKKHSGCSVFTE